MVDKLSYAALVLPSLGIIWFVWHVLTSLVGAL